MNDHIFGVNSNRPALAYPRGRGRTGLAGLLRSGASRWRAPDRGRRRPDELEADQCISVHRRLAPLVRGTWSALRRRSGRTGIEDSRKRFILVDLAHVNAHTSLAGRRPLERDHLGRRRRRRVRQRGRRRGGSSVTTVASPAAAAVGAAQAAAVKITSSNLPATGLTVGYAMTSGGTQVQNASRAYRWGQLRDSDPFVGSTTRVPRPSNAVAFEMPVP